MVHRNCIQSKVLAQLMAHKNRKKFKVLIHHNRKESEVLIMAQFKFHQLVVHHKYFMVHHNLNQSKIPMDLEKV